MDKAEQLDFIRPIFNSVIEDFYKEGDWCCSTMEKFEELKKQAERIELSAGYIRDGEDIIIFVEKLKEYTLILTRLNIFTYEDAGKEDAIYE